MPRGETLSTLRTRYKALTRTAQNNTNTVADDEIDELLYVQQDELARSNKWPFLLDRWSLVVPAGTRYIALPTANVRGITSSINTERPLKVSLFLDNNYAEVDYGIAVENFNVFDSEADVRSNRIMKWSLDTNTQDSINPNEIEVWPIPNIQQKLYFEGVRHLNSFSADSDKSDLDGTLIVLYTAADTLMMKKIPNWELMLKRAKERLHYCLMGVPGPTTVKALGASARQPISPRLVGVAAS